MTAMKERHKTLAGRVRFPDPHILQTDGEHAVCCNHTHDPSGDCLHGGDNKHYCNIGLTNSIFIITLITLSVVVMWSFFLASSITNPIVKLSKIATSMSTGELKNPEIELSAMMRSGNSRPHSTAWSIRIKSSTPFQKKTMNDRTGISVITPAGNRSPGTDDSAGIGKEIRSVEIITCMNRTRIYSMRTINAQTNPE